MNEANAQLKQNQKQLYDKHLLLQHDYDELKKQQSKEDEINMYK